jgi:hypothetical protein
MEDQKRGVQVGGKRPYMVVMLSWARNKEKVKRGMDSQPWNWEQEDGRVGEEQGADKARFRPCSSDSESEFQEGGNSGFPRNLGTEWRHPKY